MKRRRRHRRPLRIGPAALKAAAGSLVAALLLCVAGYFVNNIPVFNSADMAVLRAAQRSFGLRRDPGLDGAVFVNVSYDKKLVPVRGVDGDPLGSVAVTDREKLASFLSMLSESGTYRYVFLDMAFEDEDVPEVDDSLFSVMGWMDRMAFALPSASGAGLGAADSSLLAGRGALAHYYVTGAHSDFAKYELLRDGIRYMPLKACEDLHPDMKMRRRGLRRLPFYTCGGKLCRNSLFTPLDACEQARERSSVRHGGSEVGGLGYYNLGADFTDLVSSGIYTREEMAASLAALAEGKCIVIGNMTEDIHSTYMGTMPGALIVYRTFRQVEEGRHVVGAGKTLLWLLCFFCIGFCMTAPRRGGKPRRRSRLRPWARKAAGAAKFALSLMSFSAVLLAGQCIELVLGLAVTNVAAAMAYFTILKIVISYKKASES